MLKHNSQGEKFIQQGFVIAGRMMYSNGKVQLLSFRKKIMGREMGDDKPKTLCLTQVARYSEWLCLWENCKWEPPIYIKYGIFIPGLFAAAEGNIHLRTVEERRWEKNRGIRMRERGRHKRKKKRSYRGKCPFNHSFRRSADNGLCLWITTLHWESGIFDLFIYFSHVVWTRKRRWWAEFIANK